MADSLRFIVRTPAQVVFDEPLLGARLPAPSGQIGLRPRGEPLATEVEPGLVIARSAHGIRYLATAGGLLDLDVERAELLTPFAAVGASGAEVQAALDRVLETPDSELVLRRRLGELEQRIVRELRQRPAGPRGEP